MLLHKWLDLLSVLFETIRSLIDGNLCLTPWFSENTLALLWVLPSKIQTYDYLLLLILFDGSATDFPVPSYSGSHIYALYMLSTAWNAPSLICLANSCSFLKMWLKYLILFEAFLSLFWEEQASLFFVLMLCQYTTKVSYLLYITFFFCISITYWEFIVDKNFVLLNFYILRHCLGLSVNVEWMKIQDLISGPNTKVIKSFWPMHMKCSLKWLPG